MHHPFFPIYFHWWHLPVLFAAGLFGESYASIIGGGSIVMQPVLLFLGVPLKSTIAIDNAGTLGTQFGILSETYQHVVKNKRLVLFMMLPITLGGVVGTWFLLAIPPTVIKYLMVAAVLFILVHAHTMKERVRSATTSRSQYSLLFVFMILSGIYGNFIGVGEGTFAKFAIMSVLGLSFMQSQGLKSAAGIPATVYSIVVTAFAGLIVWPYVITFWIATFIAGKYSTKFVKRVPDKTLKAALTIMSVAFVLYLLFLY